MYECNTLLKEKGKNWKNDQVQKTKGTFLATVYIIFKFKIQIIKNL
jgi:hypothetical protein